MTPLQDLSVSIKTHEDYVVSFLQLRPRRVLDRIRLALGFDIDLGEFEFLVDGIPEDMGVERVYSSGFFKHVVGYGSRGFFPLDPGTHVFVVQSDLPRNPNWSYTFGVYEL